MIQLLPYIGSVKKPSNSYLIALSTPHGIMQHTLHNLPDPEHGYAVDDNARALIVAHIWKNEGGKNIELMRGLETSYLRTIKYAQDSSGKFYCYISFDLQRRDLGMGDWYGRALYALSFIGYYSKKFGTVAWDIFHRSLHISFDKDISPRTASFLLIAYYYLTKNDDKNRILPRAERKRIEKEIQHLNKYFLLLAKKCTKKWYWPEEAITYDNGKLIQAYYLLYFFTQKQSTLNIAENMLDFYLDKTLHKGYFQAPGNRGFYQRGKKMPLYDEQALEAYSIISALVTAYRLTKRNSRLSNAKTVYDWYYGKNRLGLSLIEKRFGAVYDGLRKDSVNRNTGAESFLSLHLAYFALSKRYIL